ncbi:MAG TPA: ATP-binding protein [Burkholderiaceae bacterium]|nr:ATP-binding protein [Burkholderiaceae bacterium]
MSTILAFPLEQTFRLMADNSPVLLWMSGRDALCTFFNQTWLDFTGRTMEQEVGFGWAEGVWPEDFQECVDTYMRAFNDRQPFEMTYRLRRHDGRYRWLLDRGVPWRDTAHEFQGFIGSCVDITDRKEAEDRTRRTALRLERARRQVERFLFALSHDLREPVRTVINHTERALQEVGTAGDVEHRHLGYALEAAMRMRRLVDGLQRFALVLEEQPEAHQPLPLDGVLDEALSQIALDIEAAGAQIVREPLPTVTGNRAQIGLLLRHLLDNAIKFRGEAPPRVRVAAERLGTEWRIAIRDNGIGIGPGYQDTIFVMFRRLVPHSRYPGSGIGLALCKEIVELHGGRIWYESETSGTAFFFTLPAADI